MKTTNQIAHVNFLEFFVNELQYYKGYLLKCTVMHRDAPWCTEKQNLIIEVTLPKYK